MGETATKTEGAIQFATKHGPLRVAFDRVPGDDGPRVALDGHLTIHRVDYRVSSRPTRYDPDVCPHAELRRSGGWGYTPTTAALDIVRALSQQVWRDLHASTVDVIALADAGAAAAAARRIELTRPNTRALADKMIDFAQQMSDFRWQQQVLGGVPASQVTGDVTVDEVLAELRSLVEWVLAPAERRFVVTVIPDDRNFVGIFPDRRVIADDEEHAKRIVAAEGLTPGFTHPHR